MTLRDDALYDAMEFTDEELLDMDLEDALDELMLWKRECDCGRCMNCLGMSNSDFL